MDREEGDRRGGAAIGGVEGPLGGRWSELNIPWIALRQGDEAANAKATLVTAAEIALIVPSLSFRPKTTGATFCRQTEPLSQSNQARTY